MMTKEDCQTLSKLLGIEFLFPNFRHLSKTCSLFSNDNNSYVSYDVDKEEYSFLLCYPNTHFSFVTRSISPEVIHAAMKESTEESFKRAVVNRDCRNLISEEVGKLL